MEKDLRMDHVGWYPVLAIYADGNIKSYDEIKDILEVRMEVAGTDFSSQTRPEGTDLVRCTDINYTLPEGFLVNSESYKQDRLCPEDLSAIAFN